MSGVVMDASVLIKLYIRELGSADAEQAVKAADLILAPDLLLPETANVIWKYVRRGELAPVDANAILDDILQMPIRITPSLELIEVALRIAVETDRTIYDSLYIALAMHANAILISADERLVNALATTRYASLIQLVANRP
jgi:predicted nucleic acid-binding protein